MTDPELNGVCSTRQGTSPSLPLGAVGATWTAPWTERGLRAPNRRQVRKVKSEARAIVKPDILCLPWARAVVKPNIDFEKWARAVVKRNIDF